MKRLLIVLLMLGALGAGGLFYFVQSDAGKGMAIGVNYAAKSLCSCVFVQGRDKEACYGDMIVASAQSIPVEIDREAGLVRASIFGIFTGEAHYQEGRGCMVQ